MKLYISFFLSVSLIFFDQFSKYLIRSQGGFYVCNESLALGLDLRYNILFILAVFIILLFFINSKLKNKNEKLQLKMQSYFPLMLILSGGLSNIIDRLYYGCVIDFIDLKLWPASIAARSVAGWPVFNLADAFIVAGVIMLILTFNKQPKTSKEAEK